MSQQKLSFAMSSATEHTLFVDGEYVAKTLAHSREEALARLRKDKVEWRPAIEDPPEEWDSITAIPF